MNLKNRFFYRLVNASRITWLTIAIITASIVSWYNIPDKNVADINSSHVVCTDNTKIQTSFSSIGIDMYLRNNKALSKIAYNKAENFCSKNAFSKHTSIVDGEIIHWQLAIDNHTLHIVYKRNWSRYPSILLTIFAFFLVFYILLNIFCETLLYLAFGKRLSWSWLLPLKKNQTV